MVEQQLQFRPARERDYLLINHVVEQAVMGWNLPERVKQLSVSSYYYHEHDFEHFRIIVAEIDKDIVGVIAWEQQPITIQENKKTLLLHGIFVSPQHHNKGIGSRLFRFATDAAKKAGCEGIIVRSQKDAKGFFAKMGMKKLDIIDDRRDYAHRYWKALK